MARAYEKAFGRARRLIYIEDQYLWSRDIARALAHALATQPELPRGRRRASLPGPGRSPDRSAQSHWSADRDATFGTAPAGTDSRAYDLDGDEWPIYVHAKVCIIDDVWMTIGSDNLNRRSWTHDSELSCAIIDDTRDDREPADPAGLGDCARVLPRETRMQLWAEHTQQHDLPVDPDVGFDMLAGCAEALDRWYAHDRVGPRPPGRLRRHRPAPVALVARPLA